MRFAALVVIFSLAISYGVSSWCVVDDNLMKRWEILKRDYAQTLGQTAKKAIEKQIIDQLANLQGDEVLALSGAQWFWNIILADVVKSARKDLTDVLTVDALNILVTRLNDVNLLREGVDVPRILSMIIENLAEDDLITKLVPLVKAAHLSGQLSEAVKKRLVPLRIAKGQRGVGTPEIDEIFKDLAAADTARRANMPKASDASWLLKLDPIDAQAMAKDKKLFEPVWNALRGSRPEIINQVKPALLELIFDELIKEQGYKSVGAIVPGSHLEIAKTIIQKLDENGPNFPILFKTVLNSVWSNIAPLVGALSVKAKKIKDSEESLRNLRLIEDAKAQRIAAVKAGVEAQKVLLAEYAQKADLEIPKAATGLYWIASPKQIVMRDFNLDLDPALKSWLSSGFLALNDKTQAKENLRKILAHYLAADDATRNIMGQAFAQVLNQEDLFDIIDDLDDEQRVGVFTQLLQGQDKRGFALIQKYWKHEAKNAGLRGKTVEERALRRMALVLYYLSKEQLNESINSDSFWGILNTYPLLAAVGLSKESLGRLAESIHEPEIKSLRSDLPNIIARIAVKIDENRPDLYPALLSIANSARDLVVAEALINKFKALKPQIVRSRNAQEANEAELLLLEAIKQSKKLK